MKGRKVHCLDLSSLALGVAKAQCGVRVNAHSTMRLDEFKQYVNTGDPPPGDFCLTCYSCVYGYK